MNPDVNVGVHLSVLVVEPVRPHLLTVVSAFEALRVHVTVAETFPQAREMLARHVPDVLVTAIRLGEYNGLHLVLRGKADRPELAAVVMSPCEDPVLRADADGMHATFVVTPTSDDELRAAVMRTRFRRPDDAEPVRAPFERRRHDRRSGAEFAVFGGSDRRQPLSERRRALLVSI